MQWYIKDQSPHFAQHLQRLQQLPVMPYNKSSLIEKTTTITINTTRTLQQLNTDFLFNYRLFPPFILTAFTQWAFEKRGMQIGDTIVQQAFLPPVKAMCLKMIFGVRINNIIQENNRMGYSYETLQGHAEKGISTFTLERTANNTMLFSIHTFSTPGSLLSRLVAPFFSIPYQAYCTRQALLHVKGQLENHT